MPVVKEGPVRIRPDSLVLAVDIAPSHHYLSELAQELDYTHLRLSA